MDEGKGRGSRHRKNPRQNCGHNKGEEAREEMRSGKGPRVWAAHFEFLVFLQHALDLREAAGASPGVQLSSQPLGPDQQFSQHCLQLLSLVQRIQRLLPAHKTHQLVPEPPSPFAPVSTSAFCPRICPAKERPRGWELIGWRYRLLLRTEKDS